MQDRDVHQFVGMQSDNDVSLQKPEYLRDALNIRFIDTSGNNTQFAIVSEKGPKQITLKDSNNQEVTLFGSYKGHCVVGDYLVIFSSSHIYRIDDSYHVIDMYSGDLNVSDDRVETIGIYENNLIQKVYWLGGDNPPRVINVAAYNNDTPATTDIKKFNFVQELKLKEEVYVSSIEAQEGIFAPGVIQYAITYYNKYLQETNIAYTTPLFSITYPDRGGSPEDKIACAFKVTVENPDSNFEYIRCYAIHRTSINAVPTVRRLVDVKNNPTQVNENNVITNYIYFVDNGTEGETVDPSLLLYVGGEDIIAHTFTHKDGTLFLGDIQIKREQPDTSSMTVGTLTPDHREVQLTKKQRAAYTDYIWSKSVLPNTNYLTPDVHFHPREKYRLGIQLQHKSGKWSAPIPLRDNQNVVIDAEISGAISEVEGIGDMVKIPTLKVPITFSGSNLPVDNGYVKARPVVVLPQLNEREVVMQGLLCPTIVNEKAAESHAPDVQSSWFLRPYSSIPPGCVYEEEEPDWDDTAFEKLGKYGGLGIAEYRDRKHLYTFYDCIKDYPAYVVDGEINEDLVDFNLSSQYYLYRLPSIEFWGWGRDNLFTINHDTLTLYSPDILFEDDTANLDFSKCSVHLIGKVKFNKSYGINLIQTSTPGIAGDSYISSGIFKEVNDEYSAGTLISPFCFYDSKVKNEDDQMVPESDTLYLWQTLAWHRSGSINNDYNRGSSGGTRTAVLSKKVLSNLKVASLINSDPERGDVNEHDTLYTTDIQLFNSDQVSQVKLKTEDVLNNTFIENYYGNIDVGVVDSESFNGVYYQNDLSSTIVHYGPYTNSKNSKIKELTRLKYKTTPHLVLQTNKRLRGHSGDTVPTGYIKEYSGDPESGSLPFLYLAEVRRAVTEKFGGNSDNAILANRWIPAGEPVAIDDRGLGNSVTVEFKYGDTWYQRFDCLKTYPFTQEDTNSVVDIVSFCCESRINLEGRYDRNKGFIDNIAMSPKNFNLLNHVYSNADNFFTYRTFDEDYYRLNKFPNSVIWSRQKTDAQSVDPWTNINMAATLNLDGNKGKIIALRTFNDAIICFQEKAVSIIRFNERVQIPTSDNNPIEITNSYKVNGYSFINDNTGTKYKNSVVVGESGIFFTGNRDGSLYQVQSSKGAFNVVDIATSKFMYNWYKPVNDEFVTFNWYDFIHRDLYSSKRSENGVLNYSDVLQAFSSKLSYSMAEDIFNNATKTYAVTGFKEKVDGEDKNAIQLWEMFEGTHSNIFNVNYPQYIEFISNDKSTLDKTFNNVEYLAERYENIDDTFKENVEKSFDYISFKNEYQSSGEVRLKFEKYLPSNLKRKFRIWRAQIPRNNSGGFLADRPRGPWVKIKIGINPNTVGAKICLHNLIVNYMY